MASVENDVYSLPSDGTRSVGIIWLHKKVFIFKSRTVRDTITGEKSEWYQINSNDKTDSTQKATGSVSVSTVERYDMNASIPDNALYQIKPGAEYTIDGVTGTFGKDSMNVILVLYRTETDGRMKFTAYGGSKVTVNSKECVEQYEGLISPAWANVT